MKFTNNTLAGLMAAPPGEPQIAAEQANLCMEERIGPARQATYESRMGDPETWDDWRSSHDRYVREEVRRRHPLSAAFTGGEPSLRPGIEPNQYLYRVERIDGLLERYATGTGAPVGAGKINGWISARDSGPPDERTVSGLHNLGRLVSGDPPSPGVAALQELTDLFNDERRDGRPSFVVFEAEFPRLKERSDWAEHLCERCGLAHFFTDGPVTLALFRYKAQEVLDARSDAGKKANATVFAVPTVIDQPMSDIYFTAPKTMPWGHAVGLKPEPDCRHLAAELIHARMDYRPDHWVAVDTMERNSLSAEDIARLREAHLDCIRRSPGNAGYGRNR